jgi:hypothetical protein
MINLSFLICLGAAPSFYYFSWMQNPNNRPWMHRKLFSSFKRFWLHTLLAQSPSLMFIVRIISWQITWLNRESEDQLTLLRGFESSNCYVGPLCFSPDCDSWWKWDVVQGVLDGIALYKLTDLVSLFLCVEAMLLFCLLRC